MLIEEMIKELSTAGKRSTDSAIWESALYYYGSIMLNKYNFRKSIGSKQYIRYYSIVFAASGIGKDFTLNTIEKICNLENYANAMLLTYTNSIANLPERPNEADINEIVRYMPKSTTIGVEGTAEGLFYVAQSQGASSFGSLNLESRELGEAISSSSTLLNKLKDLYDNSYKAKIIKGDVDTEMKADLSGIICNFIGLGSRKGIAAENEKELKRIVSSGMFRRTFIIDSKEPVAKNKQETNIEQLTNYIESLNENFKAEYLSRNKAIDQGARFFEYTEQYELDLEEIDDDLIKRANDNPLNEFAQYNTGSLEMIIDLSHIIAFLEWDTTVTENHLKKAYNFMVRTRDSVEDTFKTIHPYKIMYDLLKLKDNMTISEMAEYEHNIPIAKNKVIDNVALLEELCYRNDEVLIHNEGKVTRYMIKPLPVTKLNEMIVSIDKDHKGKFAINYVPLKIKFFGKSPSIEVLVLSEKVDSFCACHFIPSAKSPDGHRDQKSFISGENMIIFDFDEGMTIEEATVVFQQYIYILYTTSSHTEEHHKFRIILPTKNTFYVEPNQHKILYENISKALDIPIYDKSCTNAGRMFFTQNGKNR